jgi:hypothetical protein
MATIYPRKSEMRALYLQPAPADAAYRVKTTEDCTFLQLKDSATGEFRSLWLASGVPQAGAGET